LSCHGGPCDVTQALGKKERKEEKKRKDACELGGQKGRKEQGFFQGSLQYIAWRFLN